MRGIVNDCLRWLIGFGIRRIGLGLEIIQRIKVSIFCWNQKRLKRRYEINADTPILSYGPALEELIENAAAHIGGDARFALTSGSTAKPKRILYTKKRLRSTKFAYIDVFARCYRALGIKRTSLYVFSSLSRDDSLTSMLIDEKGRPPYLSTLQAPYRIQSHPILQALASCYGATAVRLWILTIANPGVLYSTNPSTLSVFLDEFATEWQRSSRLIKDWCERPETFHPTLHMIAARLASRGSSTRLRRIATSAAPLHLDDCAPGVAGYVCWTGGYVKPFLDRIAIHLPPERYRLIPMYSMSTETIETVSCFRNDNVAFLPLASRVLYEFIEEGMDDRPKNLLTADQLEAGRTYTMVVSDPYGLCRYQTGDLFLCRGQVGKLPDLRFVRRRDLEYSFTGEKLTAKQVSTVFQQLREEFASLKSDAFLTCVPSQPVDEPLPHYKIVLIGAFDESTEISVDELAGRCDALLGEMNCEYKSKRESGRLGHVQLVRMPINNFINRMSGPQHPANWETQFKFLPLYRRTWESLSASFR
ncbi:MAG: GH3 auxin-responsive promoter family protein [Pyrinomonadaceae bacterium]|nr:GH3 auxin-responsive promoter family protein [Pyrinomonadaceae bacterium]